MSIFREDRIFDNFLEIQTRRMDDGDGFAASDRQNAIRKLRAHRRARRMCCDECCDTFERDSDNGFEGTFLQWLIENVEKVFAFIKRIMALFGL